MIFLWSHLGLNQGPPDYESGATNQLSYRTPFVNRRKAQLSKAAAKVQQKMHICKKKSQKVYFQCDFSCKWAALYDRSFGGMRFSAGGVRRYNRPYDARCYIKWAALYDRSFGGKRFSAGGVRRYNRPYDARCHLKWAALCEQIILHYVYFSLAAPFSLAIPLAFFLQTSTRV